MMMNDVTSGGDVSKFPVLLSSLVVPKIIEKFSLNPSTIGALYPLITISFSYIFNYYHFSLNISWFYIITIVLLFYIGYYYNKTINKYKKRIISYIFKTPNSKNPIVLSIYCIDKILLFSRYCQLNSNSSWKYTDVDQTIGNEHTLKSNLETKTSEISNVQQLHLAHLASSSYPSVNTVVKFHDEKLGITGTYVWKEFSFTEKVSQQNNSYIEKEHCQIFPELTFTYIDEIIETREIILRMKKILDKTNKETDNIAIYASTISNTTEKRPSHYSPSLISYGQKLYSGEKQNTDELEKQHLDNYFHKNKMEIWKLVKQVHFNPEFFYNFGQTPSCNLLFYGPPGSGKSTFISRIARTLQRSIITLDMKKLRIKRYLQDYLINPIACEGSYSLNTIQKINLQVNEVIYVIEEFDNYIEFLVNSVINNEKQNKKYEKKKPEEKEEKKKNTQLPSEEEYQFDYNIKDLLDIFQGTVPADGRIIIATTNNIDYIHNQCPALVRDGRFTPIEFGYLDENTFDAMCMYFFNTTFDYSVNICTIPTSKIMYNLMNSKIYMDIQNSKNHFQQFLDSLE